MLQRFTERIKDHGVAERAPLLEGKSMHLTVASLHKPKEHEAARPARARTDQPEDAEVAPVEAAEPGAVTPPAAKAPTPAAEPAAGTPPAAVANAPAAPTPAGPAAERARPAPVAAAPAAAARTTEPSAPQAPASTGE
jgi:hypothetical protein